MRVSAGSKTRKRSKICLLFQFHCSPRAGGCTRSPHPLHHLWLGVLATQSSRGKNG